MTEIKRSETVPYTAQQMFELVNNVNNYKEFLPWCSDSSIVSEKEGEMEARIEIRLGSLNKAFSTVNRYSSGKMIEMSLLDGPFKHLEGFWKFEDLSEETGKSGCEVSLHLEYEFANKIISFAIGPAFGKIASSLIDAFCERSHVLYGEDAPGQSSSTA